MATTPAANPSRPSMKFTELAITATHRTVASAARSGLKTSVVWASGHVEKEHVDAEEIEHCAGQHLAGQLGRRRHLPYVVRHPDGEDDRGREHHAQGRRTAAEHRCERRELRGHRNSDQHPEVHAGPAAGGVGRSWTRRSSGSRPATGASPKPGRRRSPARWSRRPPQR